MQASTAQLGRKGPRRMGPGKTTPVTDTSMSEGTMLTVTAEGAISGDYWQDMPRIHRELENEYAERCESERMLAAERAAAEMNAPNVGRPKAEVIPGYSLPEGAIIDPKAKHKSYDWSMILPIIKELADKGESYRSIAMTLGIPDQTIYHKIKQLKRDRSEKGCVLRAFSGTWGGVA